MLQQTDPPLTQLCADIFEEYCLHEAYIPLDVRSQGPEAVALYTNALRPPASFWNNSAAALAAAQAQAHEHGADHGDDQQHAHGEGEVEEVSVPDESSDDSFDDDDSIGGGAGLYSDEDENDFDDDGHHHHHNHQHHHYDAAVVSSVGGAFMMPADGHGVLDEDEQMWISHISERKIHKK